MILKDIAEKTGLDISTVSRVANSKFVQTEFGTYRLKFFFSESLSTDSGEEVSTREVKKILSDLIEGENKKKPLSDERLTELLQEKGYNIARRTVAKYREQLNIPGGPFAKRIIVMPDRLIITEENQLKEVSISETPPQPAWIRVIAKIISYIFHPLFIPVYLTYFIIRFSAYEFAGH